MRAAVWLSGALLLLVAAAGVWFASQSPTFVAGIVALAAGAAWKAMAPKVARRMSPEQEAEFQRCMRRGGEWDHIRKRCKD